MTRGAVRGGHLPTLELLEAPPAAVDAGAVLRFAVRAACGCGCDPGAEALLVEGPGAEAAELVRVPAGEGRGVDTRVAMRAPAEVGPASWTVRLREREAGRPLPSGPVLPVAIKVVPHRTSLAVWQVPSPIQGSAFTVRVGATCSARCALGGARVELVADSGARLGEGTLAGEPRPGSSGLYEAEVPLLAPDEEGVFFCKARFHARELELPHEPAEAPFSFRALTPPECTVTVCVVGEALTAPLDGIEVRLGPYRAETDARGEACVAVPKGQYVMSAWRRDIACGALEVDISGDAELTIPVAPKRRFDADEEREWM